MQRKAEKIVEKEMKQFEKGDTETSRRHLITQMETEA